MRWNRGSIPGQVLLKDNKDGTWCFPGQCSDFDVIDEDRKDKSFSADTSHSKDIRNLDYFKDSIEFVRMRAANDLTDHPSVKKVEEKH